MPFEIIFIIVFLFLAMAGLYHFKEETVMPSVEKIQSSVVSSSAPSLRPPTKRKRAVRFAKLAEFREFDKDEAPAVYIKDGIEVL